MFVDVADQRLCSWAPQHRQMMGRRPSWRQATGSESPVGSSSSRTGWAALEPSWPRSRLVHTEGFAAAPLTSGPWRPVFALHRFRSFRWPLRPGGGLVTLAECQDGWAGASTAARAGPLESSSPRMRTWDTGFPSRLCRTVLRSAAMSGSRWPCVRHVGGARRKLTFVEGMERADRWREGRGGVQRGALSLAGAAAPSSPPVFPGVPRDTASRGGSRSSRTCALTGRLQVGAPIHPSLGPINLLEWRTDLREAFYEADDQFPCFPPKKT